MTTHRPSLDIVKTPPVPPQATAPDSTQPLPHGTLPCAVCGVSVAPPHTRTAKVEVARKWVHDDTMADRQRLQIETVTVTRCPSCAALSERARAVLAAHPSVAQRVGGIALERLLSALAAADALPYKVALDSPEATRAAIAHLASAGQAVRWRAQDHPGQCATGRWAYLTADDRTGLREAAAALMASRVARPRPIAPPPDSAYKGCLLCGRATVRGLPSDRVWSFHRFPGRALGQPGTALYSGYCCPLCETALEDVGSIGPSALTAAVRAHLKLPKRLSAATLTGLRAWVVSSPTPKPSAVPWLHADLSAAARLLAIA